MANAPQLDYGEQGTNVEDDTDTTGIEDMSPPDDEAQMLHAFQASHKNDASPADLHMYSQKAQNACPQALSSQHSPYLHGG